MTFINDYETLVRTSKKELFNFRCANKVIVNVLDDVDNVKKTFTLCDKRISYINASFDIDNEDNIYGIINDDNGKVLSSKYTDSEFITSTLFKYDVNRFGISYPYMKKINNSTHVFYYVNSNDNNSISALYHHYKYEDTWFENKIDFIYHTVLNNFVVLWEKNTPIIYYYNLVNGCEELFVCIFNINKKSWGNPIQITNSRKSKMYLSVAKDCLNFYHIVYSENANGAYAVKYINGYLNERSFKGNDSKYITGPSTCSFPNLTILRDRIYIMWVQYNKLYTSYSDDVGKTWSEHSIDEYSIEEDFIRYNFKSNFINDKPYNTDCVFSTKNPIGILGY